MSQDILKNKYLMIPVIVVIAAGIIVISQIASNGDPPGGGGENVHNPNYNILRNNIKEFGQQKWNRSSFKILQQQIIQFSNTTPEPLIDLSQKNDLIDLLEVQYLSVIYDTIKKFCEFADGRDVDTLQRFQRELESFSAHHGDKTANMLSLIQTFRTIRGYATTISHYAETRRYNESITNSYKERVRNFRAMDYFKKNRYLMSLLSECSNKMDVQSGLEARFLYYQVNRRIYFCNCDSLFSRNSFYLAYCDSLYQLTHPEE